MDNIYYNQKRKNVRMRKKIVIDDKMYFKLKLVGIGIVTAAHKTHIIYGCFRVWLCIAVGICTCSDVCRVMVIVNCNGLIMITVLV